MKIPHEQLDEETLTRVIESFILREGTDYGEREASLESKVASVRRQLDRGDAHLLFDQETESLSIVHTSELPKR